MATEKPGENTPAHDLAREQTKEAPGSVSDLHRDLERAQRRHPKTGAKIDQRASHEVKDAVVAPGHTVTVGDPEGYKSNYGPGETVSLYVDDIDRLTASGFLVEEDPADGGGDVTRGRGVAIRGGGSGPAVKPKDDPRDA